MGYDEWPKYRTKKDPLRCFKFNLLLPSKTNGKKVPISVSLGSIVLISTLRFSGFFSALGRCNKEKIQCFSGAYLILKKADKVFVAVNGGKKHSMNQA